MMPYPINWYDSLLNFIPQMFNTLSFVENLIWSLKPLTKCTLSTLHWLILTCSHSSLSFSLTTVIAVFFSSTTKLVKSLVKVMCSKQVKSESKCPKIFASDFWIRSKLSLKSVLPGLAYGIKNFTARSMYFPELMFFSPKRFIAAFFI